MSTVQGSAVNPQKPSGTQPGKREQKPKDRPAQPQQPSRPNPRQSNDLHARLEALKVRRPTERELISARQIEWLG